MTTILKPEELKSIFNGHQKRSNYDEALELYKKISVHANGEIPIKLIKDARPNESQSVREYREKIYEAETQNPIERVLGVLEKIRRSPDWMMRFDEEVPASIDKKETLEKYLKNNFPTFKNIDSWLFEECLKVIALDSNAVIAVLPKSFEINGTDYIQPIPQIFYCYDVLDFVAEDYAVLKSDEFSTLLSAERRQQMILAASSVKKYETFVAAQVYYVVNSLRFEKWETDGEKFVLTKIYNHNLNELPVFQVPGKFFKRIGHNVLKKTPLFPMVPHLNKAARESSDLDAGVVMHLYLEKWRINNMPCNECEGLGSKASESGNTPCKKCQGSGYANGKSPFNEIVIKPAAVGEQNIPTPPIGYVDKNPEIIRLQNERIEQHLYKALASVNMEHLSEAQLNQSGVAKQYDRDELNNLITTFAEALVECLEKTVYFIASLRYKNLITNEEQFKKLLPVIPVPEKFDVVNSSFLITEYGSAKTAGLNSIILTELQKEIASKKFYSNPKVSAFVNTVMEMDPFPDKSTEEKSQMESQGLATKEDVVLSNYISDFVRQAVELDEAFSEKPFEKKKEVLMKMAKEKADALNEAKKMMAEMFVPGIGNEENEETNKEEELDKNPKEKEVVGATK